MAIRARARGLQQTVKRVKQLAFVAQNFPEIVGVRRVIKRYERDVKYSAPYKTGKLSKSIRVHLVKRSNHVILRVEGNRAMVPQNARTGFLSRDLDRLPDKIVDAVGRELNE